MSDGCDVERLEAREALAGVGLATSDLRWLGGLVTVYLTSRVPIEPAPRCVNLQPQVLKATIDERVNLLH